MVQMVFLNKNTPGIASGGKFPNGMSDIEDGLLGRRYFSGKVTVEAGCHNRRGHCNPAKNRDFDSSGGCFGFGEDGSFTLKFSTGEFLLISPRVFL